MILRWHADYERTYRDFGAVNAAMRMAAQARARPWAP